MRRLLIILFFAASFSLQAQQIKSKGSFLSDSIKIGMDIRYSLSATYPSNQDVVFPDSTFNFSPFEYVGKKYFTTKTDSTYSYDSAVYIFTTFEVDSVQFLRLPVFIVTRGDSSAIYTEMDSVILQHVVAEIPDTTGVENMPLKENVDFLPLVLQFNYPYLIIGIIILIIAILLVIIIFGKRIRKLLSYSGD